MVNSTIPNFHSGVSEDLRSGFVSYAVPQEGFGYDIAAWTIVHERERGLPTFNEYFRKYPGKIPVKIRETFEEFTSDPELVKELKRLYRTPDEVDFMVGLQLDEDYFPGTTVPNTMLITSLFSLFGLAASDRFSIAYTGSLCFLVGKPWDCTPLNPVDELFWAPLYFLLLFLLLLFIFIYLFDFFSILISFFINLELNFILHCLLSQRFSQEQDGLMNFG